MSRFGYVMTTYFAVMLIGVLSIISFAPKLIWNASASTPIGLYAISASDVLEATDLVAVAAPEPIASAAAQETTVSSHATAHATPRSTAAQGRATGSRPTSRASIEAFVCASRSPAGSRCAPRHGG